MAASTSTTALTAKHLRRTMPLLDRFVVRETRLQAAIKQHGGDVAAVPHIIGKLTPQPTQFYRDPLKGRWFRPRLSLRRQAMLAKSAYAEGRFDQLYSAFTAMRLNPGPKIKKFHDRIRELESEQERKLLAGAVQGSEEESSSGVIDAVKAHTIVSQRQADEQARRLAKAIASNHGPYRGRSPKNIFKGTIAEREAPARRQKVVERMAKMDETIAAWRKARREAKIKEQPKLPF